jgi:hypothetical protein
VTGGVKTTWYRNASNFGTGDEERYIQEQLERLWPDTEYPVHISVVGAADNTAAGVQVWNGTDIKIIERAYPEDYLGATHPIASAAMAKVEEIITRLKELQKF